MEKLLSKKEVLFFSRGGSEGKKTVAQYRSDEAIKRYIFSQRCYFLSSSNVEREEEEVCY